MLPSDPELHVTLADVALSDGGAMLFTVARPEAVHMFASVMVKEKFPAERFRISSVNIPLLH